MRSVEDGLGKFRLYFRDNKALGHAIVTLNDGTPVHLEPGQAVPENVDSNAYWEPFDSAQEAEEVFKILHGTESKINVPGIGARKFIDKKRGIRRYEVLESDWDVLIAFAPLLPWVRKVLNLLRDRQNQPTAFQDIKPLLSPNLAISNFAGFINKILGPHGFRVLRVGEIRDFGSWDPNNTFQLFYVPLEDRRRKGEAAIWKDAF